MTKKKQQHSLVLYMQYASSGIFPLIISPDASPLQALHAAVHNPPCATFVSLAGEFLGERLRGRRLAALLRYQGDAVQVTTAVVQVVQDAQR